MGISVTVMVSYTNRKIPLPFIRNDSLILMKGCVSQNVAGISDEVKSRTLFRILILILVITSGRVSSFVTTILVSRGQLGKI